MPWQSEAQRPVPPSGSGFRVGGEGTCKPPPGLKSGGFPARPVRAVQFYGSVTGDCQSPDVPGGVHIGVRLVAACLASKLALASPVGFRAMTTLGARPTGVP